MQPDPLNDSGDGRRSPNHGWALYFGVAAILQLLTGGYLAVTFAWGWLVAIGMLGVGVMLARRAWHMARGD